jgi:hypothetical protein
MQGLPIAQKDLAERLDVTPRCVRGWQAGEGMRAARLVQLADVLQSTPRHITNGPKPRAVGRRPGTQDERLERIEAQLAELRALLEERLPAP